MENSNPQEALPYKTQHKNLKNYGKPQEACPYKTDPKKYRKP